MAVFWKYVSWNLISFVDVLNFIMKVFIALILTSLCFFSCEPFDLDQKSFPVCEKPEGIIGFTVSKLEVTFYLENPKGDIGAVGWDLGDGRNRSGNQFTVIYQKPGTYNVSMVLANQCDDRYTATQLVTVSN
ncbi:PKD domain-containing protein [Larkinella arboricola]|uniref:PKD domain-containing protein n=2 Tax=Larkinella arboricola TaxID=643671 RepID=A0A327X9S9_LARAB|nr:PKD domain-containing protein [Larkinella arboricola]